MKTYNEIKQSKNIKTYVLDEGLRKISNLVGGFNCGELITISSRTGIGKTTLATSLISEFNKQGLKTLFISCEMTCEEIKDKINRYKNFMNIKLKPSKLFIDDGKFNLPKIEKDINECRPNIVFIDYIQLLQDNSKKDTSLLKKLAKQYNCVIFVLAQLNKGTEVSKPRLGFLKDCGNIEQDSDQVWFIWQTPLEYVNGDKALILMIAKNKKGKTGYIPVDFDKDNQAFRELTDKADKDHFNALKEYDKEHDWKANLANLQSDSIVVKEKNNSIGYILDKKFII